MRAAAVMRMRQFRLLVAGEMAEAAADALFGRADDLCVETLPVGGSLPVVPSLPPGDGSVAAWVSWVAFDRAAPTFIDAVVSGVRDLDAAGLGIAAALPDDSLVTAEVVAERVGWAVEAVRDRLPAPVGAHPRRPVFDWGEVLESGSGFASLVDEEAALEAVSLALRLRGLAPRLERMAAIRSLL
jgi:hypothetical protein